jgi:Adenosylmethionine-8-amino-7-oxononanoate aminotransferase
MRNADLVARDLKSVWHPCTQMKDHESLPLIPIKRGEGVWLEDFEGNRYIDAVSSWWVNLFGHANPRINAAIQKQIGELEHVILAGFSHEPVVNFVRAADRSDSGRAEQMLLCGQRFLPPSKPH